MKIRALLLENIRSHKKTLIKFEDGFTCLVGGLGRGKSSILYAIDFALFGDPLGRSYEYLLREGSDRGKVALKFLVEGKEYTIWRVLKRRNGRISQDMDQLKLFEGVKIVAELKSDAVEEQLKTITGIDKEIFRDVIWIRQEHLKDLLDMRPTERRKRLDNLFGISDYEVAWTNMRSIINWYEATLQNLEKDPEITRIKELQLEYEKAVKEFAENKEEIERLKSELSIAEKRRDEAAQCLQELKTLRRKNEELRAKESDLQARLIYIEDLSARLADKIQKGKEKIEKLNQEMAWLQTKEEKDRAKLEEIGVPSELDFENLREQLNIIIEQLAGVQNEEETARKEIEEAKQKILTLKTESKCPLCLQPLSVHYKDDLLNRISLEIYEREERIRELKRNIYDLRRIRSILSETLANLQDVMGEIKNKKRQIEEEYTNLEKATREFEEKQKEEERLREKLKSLRSEIRKINLEELEEAERNYRNADLEYIKVQQELKNAENKGVEIAYRIDMYKERLDEAYKKIERMKMVKIILDTIKGIRQAYRSIQPKLRREFIQYLEKIVQQVLDELIGLGEPSLFISIDEDYTPSIRSEEGHERSATNLSGGERTLLAFAYRLGIGQLIMQSRIGRGLRMLLLDEPTESLGREDGSIDRLAESLSKLKTVEQIIAVTHSEAFAEKADHVIRVTKEDNASKVSVER